MKQKALLYHLVIVLIPIFSFSGYNPYPDDRPVEFLKSILLGTKTVNLHIPRAYKMVSQDSNIHQNKLEFILDKESQDNWSQHLALCIVNNTTETASMRVQSIQHYFQAHSMEMKVLDVDVRRRPDGLQDASISLLFTDEDGEQVLSAHYYSDSASLIGAEVIKKTKGSVGSARRFTDRLAGDIIHLSNT